MRTARTVACTLLLAACCACSILEPHLNSAPQAAFTWTECPCANFLVRFDDHSFDPDENEGGGIRSKVWSFEPGNVEADLGPYREHRYTNPGWYTVTLTVKDNDNVAATATHNVWVH